MKWIILVLSAVIFLTSCEEPQHGSDDPQYSISINVPTRGEFTLGESLDIEVSFSSALNETVHHVQISIIESENGRSLYQRPIEPHIHRPSGYVYKHTYTLSAENSFKADQSYQLIASVWGHSEGIGEVAREHSFRVN